MPDATSRFSPDGKPIFSLHGTSTFSTGVAPEIRCQDPQVMPVGQGLLHRLGGVTTGIGAVIFTAKVAGAVVVFGPAVNVIQGAKMVGPTRSSVDSTPSARPCGPQVRHDALHQPG
jgi:S-(hydroxymethyl)glutathione dehydrogenase/alcohol dehydrogenase